MTAAEDRRPDYCGICRERFPTPHEHNPRAADDRPDVENYVVKTDSPAAGKGVHIGTWDEVAPTIQAMAKLGSVRVERLR